MGAFDREANNKILEWWVIKKKEVKLANSGNGDGGLSMSIGL